MAKIEEHLIVLKISRIVKDKSKDKTNLNDIVSSDILANLEQLAQELLGEGVVVEVEN